MRLLILALAMVLPACGPGVDLSMVGEWGQDEQDAFRAAADNWCSATVGEHCPVVHAGGDHVPARIYRDRPIPCYDDGCHNDDDHLDGQWHHYALVGDYELALRDRWHTLKERDDTPVTRGRYLEYLTCTSMHEMGHMLGLDDVDSDTYIQRLMWRRYCAIAESWDSFGVFAADLADFD